MGGVDLPRGTWIAIAIGVLVAIGFWQGVGGPRIAYEWLWLVTAVLLLVAIGGIGKAVSGRFDGVLIDSRNRISLSNFQTALWTVLIISALITAARVNLIFAERPEAVILAWLKGQTVWLKEHPLWAEALNPGWITQNRSWVVANLPVEITIVPELLLVMGISVGSLIGSSALLSLKAQQPVTGEVSAETADKLKLDQDQIRNRGAVFGRTESALASWADMFRGDEVGNAAATDLGKVQQFAITLLLLAIFGATLWTTFSALNAKTAAMGELPRLGDSFVWLLGVSHAGYLLYKATPKPAPQGGGAGGSDPRNAPVG